MEKTINILKIILLSILIIILVGILLLFTNKSFNFDFDEKATLVYDKNIEEEFNKIDIYSKSLDFKFVKATDSNVNVKVYDNEENDVTVNVEDGILKIVSDNDIKLCLFCFNIRKEVIITLPEEEYDLIIKTDSGDITSNIDFNEVVINSTSGDVRFNNIKEANIKVTSGDISINDVDNLKIKSTSGDIEINNVNKYLDIEATSGDIDISNLELIMNSRIKVISGDVSIFNGSNDIYYNAKTSSGDVNINSNNRHADVELTINITSGDVTVKND